MFVFVLFFLISVSFIVMVILLKGDKERSLINGMFKEEGFIIGKSLLKKKFVVVVVVVGILLVFLLIYDVILWLDII